ncbi:hypothetical protein VUR80DRAFT_9914 [Thermomyces stellatus]
MARTSPSPEPPVSPLRGTARIPKDQAALLDKSDSWIASLKASTNPLGLVNLPAHVLNSLTDYHRKRLQNRFSPREVEGIGKRDVERGEPGEPQEGAGWKGSTRACTTPEAGAADFAATPSQARALAVNHEAACNEQQQPGSSPEIKIPWSPSPNRDQARFVEQRSSNVPESRLQPQLPPSSLDIEEELDVVTAQGVRDTVGPTNLGTPRGLSPSPTPENISSQPLSCWQGDRHLMAMDIDEEPQGDMRADSKLTKNAHSVPGRRARRMKGPVFSPTSQPTAHLDNRLTTTEMQPAPRFVLDNSGASLSSTDTQASLVRGDLTSPCGTSGLGKRQNPHTSNPDPIDETSSKRLCTTHSDAAYEEPAHRETLPSLPEDGAEMSPVAPSPISAGEASGPDEPHTRQASNPDLRQDFSSMRPRAPPRDTSCEDAARQEILVPATPSERYPNLVMTGRIAQPIMHLKPFDAYREAYPEYHGSLTDFVNACISLEYLQHEDLMRDLLYDDFIHAWEEGYIRHVTKYGDDALPAYRWFNRLGGRVGFDKMIITRKNLHMVSKAYPEEYRGVLRRFKLDQSPERPMTSRTSTHAARPGSSQEGISRSRQATPTLKGGLKRDVPATLPRPTRSAPNPQVPSAEVLPRPHSGTGQHVNGLRSTSLVQVVHEVGHLSQAPPIIPATQSPGLAAVNERAQSDTIQGSYHQLNGRRPVHPHTPYSIVAESPLKQVVTPMEQGRRSSTPHSHLFDRALQQGFVSDERMPPLPMSKITSSAIIPAAVQEDSGTKNFTPMRATAQASKEAAITPIRRNRDGEHDSSFAERVTLDVGDANDGLTGHAITNSDRPFPNISFDSSQTTHGGTAHHSSESRVRSPDLHSSAYASASPPRTGNPDYDDGGGGHNTSSMLVEDWHTKAFSISSTKEDERIADGRVQKETGRKSLGSKDGREDLENESSGGKRKKRKKKKKRRMTMEEALQEFVLKRRAEKAATSSVSGH